MPSPSTMAFDNAFGMAFGMAFEMAFEKASGNSPEKLNVRE